MLTGEGGPGTESYGRKKAWSSINHSIPVATDASIDLPGLQSIICFFFGGGGDHDPVISHVIITILTHISMVKVISISSLVVKLLCVF